MRKFASQMFSGTCAAGLVVIRISVGTQRPTAGSPCGDTFSNTPRFLKLAGVYLAAWLGEGGQRLQNGGPLPFGT